VSYYSEPGSFSVRHLDLMRDVLQSSPEAASLELVPVRQDGGR
jgi:hypothetical protein